MNIGAALKELRKSKGFNQGEVSTALNITQSYLSRIETNDKKPASPLLEAICLHYGLPVVLVLWKALTEEDILIEKRAVFNQIKPLMDSLINQIF